MPKVYFFVEISGCVSCLQIPILDDIFFSDSLRRNSEAVFAARKDKDNFIDYEFKLYPGMPFVDLGITLSYMFHF